jgi:hypothetical protein
MELESRPEGMSAKLPVPRRYFPTAYLGERGRLAGGSGRTSRFG